MSSFELWMRLMLIDQLFSIFRHEYFALVVRQEVQECISRNHLILTCVQAWELYFEDEKKSWDDYLMNYEEYSQLPWHHRFFFCHSALWNLQGQGNYFLWLSLSKKFWKFWFKINYREPLPIIIFVPDSFDGRLFDSLEIICSIFFEHTEWALKMFRTSFRDLILRWM